MRSQLKKISTLLLVTIAFASCSSDADPIPEPVSLPVLSLPCVTTNTLFQQLYNPLNTVAYPESLSLFSNVEIHEYTFNVTNAATICSIGYQSQPALASQNYQIDIYDTVTSTVVATIVSTFSSTATSYTSLNTPLVLVAGRSYKIKRYGPPSSSATYANGAGRCVYNTSTFGTSPTGNVSFPKTFGNLTITDSDFYTRYLYGIVSANDNNNSMPYIDIVFQ